MRGLTKLADAIDALNSAVGRAVSWLCVLMVLIGAWNAVARYLGRFVGVDLSSNSFIEAQWYLFSLLFLLGAGATLRDDSHVRVDVLYGRLGPRGKAWIDLVGTLVFLLPFCVFGVVESWDWVANSWAGLEGSPDPGGLPRYPLKTVVPVAFLLLGLQGVSMVIRKATLLFGAPGPGAPEAHDG
ncbi:MAG: TRAP transporter small permease subunit [Deltaproteobacteria bacterium]|nr:TRAP transporter small permease subunit [Deltaproteobacteria bacterium]